MHTDTYMKKTFHNKNWSQHIIGSRQWICSYEI